MPRPAEVGTLRARLREGAGGAFRARDRAVLFAAIAHGTSLGGRLADLAGASVLVATRGQLDAALALIELDGVARRIVIAPPDLAPEAVATVIADAAVDAIVTDVDGDDHEVARVVAPTASVVPVADLPEAAHDTEWVLLTSGTSGPPKMVAHTLEGLTAPMRRGGVPGGPAVWATFYDVRRYGGLQILLRAVWGRASLVLSDPDEPVADHLRRLGRAGVTHVSGTPSHWRRALMSAQAGAMAPGYVRLSGEIADGAVLDGLAAAYPAARIGHAYASTEAGVGFDVTDGREGFPASFLGRRDDVEMKVENGSLRIRSARTAGRYLGASPPALKDADGFVDTGDLVELRGERLHFAGRRSGVINVGGRKVAPEEIEAVINGHPRVRMSLARGRRSPITGAIVVADVVRDDGAEADATLRDEILHACRAALASHKVPAAIRFVPALAVTAGGKLARSLAG